MNRQLKHCLNLQILTQKKKTLHPDQPFNKTKICVMDSHTHPLSNENLNIFKSLYFRELTCSKPPREQIFKLNIDRFEEDSWNEIIQLVEDSLDLNQVKKN